MHVHTYSHVHDMFMCICVFHACMRESGSPNMYACMPCICARTCFATGLSTDTYKHGYKQLSFSWGAYDVCVS